MTLLEAFTALAQRALHSWTSPQNLGNLICLAILLAFVPSWRRTGERTWAGYRERSFRTDVLYSVFYVGGFYAFFISGPVYRVLRDLASRHLSFLELNLVAGLPAWLQFLISSVVMDGIAYGVHRLAHASPLLWTFHSIHHSQAHLTPLSNFRFHFMDVLVRTLVQFLPGLILGTPAAVWVAVVWVQLTLEALAHADLDWSLGPLEGVIVSPRFHRVHHSVEPRHLNRNFSVGYSFWDSLFGTASPDLERPRAFGLVGGGVPESFLRQLVYPFAVLLRMRGRAAPVPAAGPPGEGREIA